ncbi:hypothetical protein ZEAMMB73_Zm00001d049700 [Zea mays]|uniref:Uncharacterized protein n=1 Tax=Zea mays TaxID=4577 RepID=A0A1D6PX40_MAIZE|nr:hypothetical protein ZEAMMB73_Zm00001d049700 [Zea mays]
MYHNKRDFQAYDEALEVRRLQDKVADFSGGSVALFMGQGKLESICTSANISTDHKLVMSKPPAVENVADGRAERMEKVRDGAPNIAKEEDKKSDRHEKKIRK